MTLAVLAVHTGGRGREGAVPVTPLEDVSAQSASVAMAGVHQSLKGESR